MSEDDAVCEAVVRQLYTAFNARRLDEAAGLFQDDAVLEHIPLGRQQRGPAGYREFAGMWLNAFPDATVEVERVNFRWRPALRSGSTRQRDAPRFARSRRLRSLQAERCRG